MKNKYTEEKWGDLFVVICEPYAGSEYWEVYVKTQPQRSDDSGNKIYAKGDTRQQAIKHTCDALKNYAARKDKRVEQQQRFIERIELEAAQILEALEARPQ